MPSPTQRDVHIEAPLSNISIAYRNTEYIGDMIFPVVPVEKRSDVYFTFDKGAFFRDRVQVRAPGTRAQRASYDISTASYVALNYALAKEVPDEVRENADNPLRPDREATEFVTDALLLGQEIRVANIITASSGTWGYSSSPATQWDNDTSDPLGDIDDAVNGVVSSIGRMPNVMVLSYDVWRKLKIHPDILDRIKHTRPGGVATPEDVAGWFDISKVLVGHAIKDTSADGAAFSSAYVWGDDLWVGFVAPNPSIMTPSAGYILEWMNREVRRYREDQERQDILEASHYTDEVVSASDSGAVIYSCVS